MKTKVQYKWFKVYFEDSDGSERLSRTYFAKSDKHAKAMAARNGMKKIGAIVPKEQK